MTDRRFHYRFSSPQQGAAKQGTIELTTAEIAAAAISEITQIALTTAPFDLFLDQLLVPNDQWFRWIGPLGQIRETKTALSGLFGRFVARAYLTRHWNFKYFEPIRSDTQTLGGWPSLSVERIQDGDLPDWIVSTALGANGIAIAEAKGSHNTSGFKAPLEAAKKQVQRINIVSGTHILKIKRYAIATRWAVQGHQGLELPWLVVYDPEEGERDPTVEEQSQLVRNIALGHFAALAEGFGLPETAAALQRAKKFEPGTLLLPQGEQVEIELLDQSTKTAICAVVTPAGIIPLPREGDLSEFRSALQTVYGDKTMLFVVESGILGATDRLLSTPTTMSMPSEEAKSFFWSDNRRCPDGSELIPLRSVVVRRVPPQIPI